MNERIANSEGELASKGRKKFDLLDSIQVQSNQFAA